jgi:aminoglycoside phosphotransferase family enzyme
MIEIKEQSPAPADVCGRSGRGEIGRDICVKPVSVDESSATTLAEKVEFLGRTAAYPHCPAMVTVRQTHMSWVFLAGDRVYKMKKPIRLPYLDFSTLARREVACRAELRLNRRLAPDVYLGVVPLVLSADGLKIGDEGAVVDWLVVMRRLDERDSLQCAITKGRLTAFDLDRLARTLTDFYRRAQPVLWPPKVLFRQWQRGISENFRILADPRLGLPTGLVRRINAVQRRFLFTRSDLVMRRIRERRIVDGHGDLRPEHIWLGEPVRIIDCLEFNPHLRAVDPFDEIAFLSVECERLGGAWVGDYLRRHLALRLRDGLGEELFLFYRCHRATLRARLAIAHMLEPHPRTPEKWPRMAREYLAIAAADTTRLERMVRTRKGR